MNNLLLINVGADRYGLWEDALTAVRGALPLHRLPLSPPAIAGITLLDDQSALIADLAASLGTQPVSDAGTATFLVIDPQEKIAGFVVEGAVGRVEVPADQVLTLPASVRTTVIDTCSVIDGSAIPIINIRVLHERLTQGDLDLPQAEVIAAPVRQNDREASFPVRAFLVGSDRFCMKAAGTSFAAIAPAGISCLPAKNGRLAGITSHDHAILPLVRLDVLPGGVEARSGRGGMLISGTGGNRHGLLVDEDLGLIEQHDLRIAELPLLVRKPWLPAAAVSRGMVYPLIETERFVSERTGPDEQDPPPSFTPGSEFPQRFRKGEVEVVEFKLLGAICSLPKDEVREVLPLLPVSRIPRTTEIVMGVAEVNGDLLPVLDLAAVFGRRSDVQGNWRMVRIANGDFHALVVAEEIAGDRRLSPEEQKRLPLALPHEELYGCYIAGGVVRLIMNVRSLAVHFEKTAVRELLFGMSPMAGAPLAKEMPAWSEPAGTAPPEQTAHDRRPLPDEALAAAGFASQSLHRSAGSDAALAADAQPAEAEQGCQMAAKACEEARHPGSVDAEVPGRADALSRAVEEAQETENEGAGRITSGPPPRDRAAVPEEQTVQGQREQKRRKYRIVAAVIAAALVLIVYILTGHVKDPVPPVVRETIPPVVQKPSPANVQPKKETPKPIKGRTMPETLPPLYLTVPPERVVSPDQEVYSVVKGDTLWGIAKRFTGDPFNYPRVARDNSIATPDLIFPGQRIRLVQEKR